MVQIELHGIEKHVRVLTEKFRRHVVAEPLPLLDRML